MLPGKPLGLLRAEQRSGAPRGELRVCYPKLTPKKKLCVSVCVPLCLGPLFLPSLLTSRAGTCRRCSLLSLAGTRALLQRLPHVSHALPLI